MSILTKTTQVLFHHKAAAVFTIVAAVIWVQLWVGNAKKLVGGYNTAPIYLRIEFQESPTELDDLDQLVIAHSAASGQPVLPELIAESSNVIRWRWVLLDRIVLAPSLKQNISGIRSVEYAFDTSCDNERQSESSVLQWKELELRSEPGSGSPGIIPVPGLNKSMLPIAPVRRAINWCGDKKLIAQSMPFSVFPYLLFLCIFCVLFAYRELDSFIRSVRKPLVTDQSLENGEKLLEYSFLRSEWRSYWPSYTAFLVFLVACALGTPVFDVNDDQSIISLLAGYWGFEPSGRALFINSVIAFPLSAAYQLFPTIPWYGSFLLSCAFLAVSVIGICLAHFSGPSRHFVIFSVFLLSCAYLPIARTTFTLVALLAASAAFVGVFAIGHWRILSRGQNSPIAGFLLWLSLALLVISAFIRLKAFLLLVALALPLGAFLFMRHCRKYGNRVSFSGLRSPLTSIYLSLVIILVGSLIDFVVYRTSPEWNSWRDQAAAMGEEVEHGRSRLRRTLAVEDFTSPAEGWTRTELQMFFSSYLLELESQSLDPLLTVMPRLRELEGARETIPAKWILATNQALFSIWAEHSDQGTARLALAFSGLVIFFLLLVGRGSNASLFAFTICWSFVLLVGVSILYKSVPYRLTCGVFFFIAAIGAIILSSDLEDLALQPSRFRVIIIATLLPLAFFQFVWHFNAWQTRKERARHYITEMETIAGHTGGPIILSHLPNNARPVLSTFQRHRELPVIPVGYLALTPTAGAARERLHTHGLIDTLKTSKRALILIANPENIIYGGGRTPELFKKYAEEKLGTNVQASIINQGFHWQWLLIETLP